MSAATSEARIVIRPMTEEDIDQVHAIDKLSFSLPWPERSYRFELFDNPASLVLVAEAHFEDVRQVVGMVVIWIILDEAHVATFAIHPDSRGRHIGQQLLAAALLDSMERGATSSALEVRTGNLGAQAMYQKFGFEVVGRRKGYYQDNREDAILMTLHKLDRNTLTRFRDL